MVKKFKGWIPTVSGRLSFSVVGSTGHTSPAIYANVADEQHRYIICYQKRWLLDGPILNLFPLFLKEPIARHVQNLEGSFWFLCIAKAPNDIDSDDPMEGSLFLFTKKLWKGDVENNVKQVQEKLNKYRTEKPGASLGAFFEESYASLTKKAVTSSKYGLQFKLYRSGVATLTAGELEEGGTAISSESSIHSLASQLYFFLKDITHRHQHHDPSTDIPIDLLEVKSDKDNHWCSQTLRVLYRQILRFKQFHSERVFNCSLGLLAYAKSFKQITGAYFTDGAKVCPDIHEDALKDSIDAINSSVDIKNNDKRRGAESFRNILLFLFGFFVSFVALIGVSKTRVSTIDPWLESVATFVLLNPFIVIASFFALLLTSSFWFRVLEIGNHPWVRNFIRVIMSFRRRYGVIILFALGALSMFLSTKLYFG